MKTELIVATVLFLIPCCGWIWNHIERVGLLNKLKQYRKEKEYISILDALLTEEVTLKDLARQTGYLKTEYAEIRKNDPENLILKLIEIKLIESEKQAKKLLKKIDNLPKNTD